MQLAQPVLLAHHLLAYFEMLERDYQRFGDALKRADVLPLGSGALAGAAYKLDREAVAKELGFTRVSANSLDAISDRDFVIEYLAGRASLCMMHLSRLAEELVLWDSAEFGFVGHGRGLRHRSVYHAAEEKPGTADRGSGRGKTGRVYGHLLALLTTMKGFPLSYNRDLQEDKEGLFDAVGALPTSLEVFTGMVQTASFKPERMAGALKTTSSSLRT